MRLSEFWQLVEQEFGAAYGRTVTARHVVHALGDRTADEAIEAGMPVRRVWRALCEDLDVPEERRYLRDRKATR